MLAWDQGGAFHLEGVPYAPENAQTLVQDSVVDQNIGTDDGGVGGASFASGKTEIKFLRSQVTNNEAVFGGAAYTRDEAKVSGR